MPKKKNEDLTPKQYFDKIVEAKLNDEDWARRIPVERGLLSSSQLKRLNEHYYSKQLLADNRYEKPDQEDLGF